MELAQRPKRLVRILERKRLLDGGFLRVDSFKLSYVLPDGSRSHPVPRLNVDRGNAVAAILHEKRTNKLHFVRQFRFSAYDEAEEPSPDNGWLVELVAGVVVPGELGNEAIVREIAEETGFKTVLSCDLIGSFFLTPGASSETLYLYYVSVDAEGREPGAPLSTGAELRGTEDEQIVTIVMTPSEFLDQVAQMHIRDAKTIAAAEFVRRNSGIFDLE